MESVEGMENFVLGTVLSYNKLNIIDQQYIVVPVLFSEVVNGGC